MASIEGTLSERQHGFEENDKRLLIGSPFKLGQRLI